MFQLIPIVPSTDIGRAPSRKGAGGLAFTLALMAPLLAGPLLGGCAISMPIPGFIAPDEDVTASIKKPVALSAAMQPEDRRLADAALTRAMEANAPLSGVLWDNAVTRRGGRFAAVAAPVQQGGRACRAFLAQLAEEPGASAKTLQGRACREPDGWAIVEVSPFGGGAPAAEGPSVKPDAFPAGELASRPGQ